VAHDRRGQIAFVGFGTLALLAVMVLAAVLLADDDHVSVRVPVGVAVPTAEAPVPEVAVPEATRPAATVPPAGPPPVVGDAPRLVDSGGTADPSLPAGWLRCTNGPRGYSIGAPADWHVSFPGSPADACVAFDPAPFRAVYGTDTFPQAVTVLPLAGQSLPEALAGFLDPAIFRREELGIALVGGRPAIFLAGTHVDGLFRGNDTVRYLVDGPNGLLLFLGAVEQTGGDAARRATVRQHLEDLVATVRFP